MIAQGLSPRGLNQILSLIANRFTALALLVRLAVEDVFVVWGGRRDHRSGRRTTINWAKNIARDKGEHRDDNKFF